jgi:hypothetical protein
MLFVIGGELREVHFPQVIKDEEWTELEKLLTLPLSARSTLDEYIGFCRELRDDATRVFGNHWFNKLSAAIEAEESSKKALDAMIAEPAFFDTLAMGLDGQHKIPATELQLIREYLKRASAEKQRLVNWYKNALARVHHDRTGQKTGRTALVVLVQAINRCLKDYTNKPISTGKRRLSFVVKVCTIAFPDLQDSNRKEKKVVCHESPERVAAVRKYIRAERRVKKVIEQVLKDHLANEQSEEIIDWQRLVPDWKPATHLVLEAEGVHIYFCTDGNHTEWHVNSTRELICPMVPFVSDEVAVQQSKMEPPERFPHGQNREAAPTVKKGARRSRPRNAVRQDASRSRANR